MTSKIAFAAAAALAALSLATGASAATVFSDSFNAESPGAPVGALTNFDISGTVDIVAPGNPYGIAASSNVLDIDGTPGPGGITTKNAFNFSAGDLVTLSFVLGGAQRGSAGDDVAVRLIFGQITNVQDFHATGLFNFNFGGGLLAPTFTAINTNVAGDTPFTLSTLSFIAVNDGSLKFGFGSSSADNIGPLLDSVKLDVTAVPEPATWALMLGGFGLAGAALRRRRAVLATA